MNNFFIYIYFSWDIYFMAAPTTLFCFYFKTTEKMSWKAKKWIRQNLTHDNNSGRVQFKYSLEPICSKPRNTLKFQSSKSWDVLKFLALKPRARTYSLNWHPWWLIPNTTSKMLKGQKTKSKLFFFWQFFFSPNPFLES